MGCSLRLDAAGRGNSTAVTGGRHSARPLIHGGSENKAKEERHIPQHIGQQGRFLCLSYQVPVKDTPHLAQTLQTNTRLKSSLNHPQRLADKVCNAMTIDSQSFVL